MDIKEVAGKYGLEKTDFWEFKRSGKSMWIITHDACEKIAAKENIEEVDIKVLSSEWDFCRMLITMKKGTKTTITIGEALLNTDEKVKDGKYGPITRGNCESQYLGCIAEKRGKDRAILKLINAYQYGVYSDTEEEDFKRPKKGEKSPARIDLEKEAIAACGDSLKRDAEVRKEMGINKSMLDFTDDELIQFIDISKRLNTKEID
ncbi:MAG: hypothetical protein GY861_13815 [bacterium]|nr:hypothetical protein [bacterium]